MQTGTNAFVPQHPGPLPCKVQSLLGTGHTSEGRIQPMFPVPPAALPIYQQQTGRSTQPKNSKERGGERWAQSQDDGLTTSSCGENLPAFPNLRSYRSDGELRDRPGVDHVPSNPSSNPSHGRVSNHEEGANAVQPHQFYPSTIPSTEPIHGDDYYNPQRQPLYVSQQTSDSAVRDMALRKGFPSIMIQETQPEPGGTGPGARPPLKSALKKPKGGGEKLGGQRRGEKKTKKMDFASFFPKAQSHAHRKSTANTPPMPPALTGPGLATNTDDERVKAPTHHGQSVLQQLSAGTASRTMQSFVPREKIFESGIYDNAKMHVRRPPKGIQNWFDGFDVSSGEEEMEDAAPLVELPAAEPILSTSRPQTHRGVVHSAAPSSPARTSLSSPAESNTLSHTDAKSTRKIRPPSRASQASKNSRVSASPNISRPRHVERRLVSSRLASESVLLLSSGSDTDDEARSYITRRNNNTSNVAAHHGKACPPVLNPPRPPIPHKRSPDVRPSNAGVAPRKPSVTATMSNSMLSRLGSSPSAPDASKLAQAMDDIKEAIAMSSRPRSARAESLTEPPRSRQSDHSCESSTPADAELLPGLQSVDGARMMAVTEEEMALLELMRRRRAELGKGSSSASSQSVVKQSPGGSTTSPPSGPQTPTRQCNFRADAPNRDSPLGKVIGEESPDMVAVRARTKPHAAKAEEFDRMARLLVTEKSLAIAPGEPSEPTMSAGSTHKTTHDLSASSPPLTPQDQPMGISVRHACVGTARVDGGGTEQFDEDDVDKHHEQIRAFLALNGVSGPSSVFPCPPRHHRQAMEDRYRQPLRLQSPPLMVEEEDDDEDGVAESHDGSEEDDASYGRSETGTDERDDGKDESEAFDEFDRERESASPSDAVPHKLFVKPPQWTQHAPLEAQQSIDVPPQAHGAIDHPGHSHHGELERNDPHPPPVSTMAGASFESPRPSSPRATGTPPRAHPTSSPTPAPASRCRNGSGSGSEARPDHGRQSHFAARDSGRWGRRPGVGDVAAHSGSRRMSKHESVVSGGSWGSVGDDVLAAWAGLGGGTTELGFRGRR